jgi:hypothetical protein
VLILIPNQQLVHEVKTILRKTIPQAGQHNL